MLHHQMPGQYGQMPFGNAAATSTPTLPRAHGQAGSVQLHHADGAYGGALQNQQQQQTMQYNGVNASAPASSMMMPQSGQSFLFHAVPSPLPLHI
jgi:hypothetical protein